MAIRLRHTGRNADIYDYIDHRGNSPVEEFIENLSTSDRGKLAALIGLFGDFGEIRNREKFVLEKKPIFAFKSFRVRICCFFIPNAARRSIVLTHGFIKKRNDMPKEELERAMRIHAEEIHHLNLN